MENENVFESCSGIDSGFFFLWRAAFLADKTGKRAVVFNHGRIFFEKIIKDNAISYPQDKTSREWTFGLIAEIEMHEPGSRSSLFQLSGGLFP